MAAIGFRARTSRRFFAGAFHSRVSKTRMPWPASPLEVMSLELSFVKTPQKAASFQGTRNEGLRGPGSLLEQTTIPDPQNPAIHFPSGLGTTFQRSPSV